MKIGPLTVRIKSSLDSEELPTPVNGKPVGVTGTRIVPGSRGSGKGTIANEDYVPDLQGMKLYKEYDKMRMSDSQIKGALSAIKLPLLAATWTVEPPENADENELAATRYCHRKIVEDKRWNRNLKQSLLCLDYGHFLFENIPSVIDDEDEGRPMAYFRLSPRMPNTIYEWTVDENDDFHSVVQMAYTSTGYKTFEIMANRLLLFTHDQEGSNPRGTSILRAARKDWYFKDRLQRINAMILEKRGAGIDVGTLSGHGVTDAMRDDAERVLMGVRSHERAFVMETENFKYRTEGVGEGGIVHPLPAIEYHDRMILRGMLLDFLGIGGGDGGSFAMHSDKTSFYLMGLRGIGMEILEPFNTDLIPKLVRMNFPNVRRMPRLRHSRLDRRDVQALVTSLKDLQPIGAITIDPNIEREIREMLDLPLSQQEDEAFPVVVDQAKRIAFLANSGRNLAEIKPPYTYRLSKALGNEDKAKEIGHYLIDSTIKYLDSNDGSGLEEFLIQKGRAALGW